MYSKIYNQFYNMAIESETFLVNIPKEDKNLLRMVVMDVIEEMNSFDFQEYRNIMNQLKGGSNNLEGYEIEKEKH